MDKKTSTKATGFKPADNNADMAKSSGAKSVVGAPSLQDKMTKVPKLPKIDGMGHDVAHASNSRLHAGRFGTDTEKAKVNSDVASNYPGCGDDCPSY